MHLFAERHAWVKTGATKKEPSFLPRRRHSACCIYSASSRIPCTSRGPSACYGSAGNSTHPLLLEIKLTPENGWRRVDASSYSTS